MLMRLCCHCLSDIVDNPNQGMWYALQLMDPEGMENTLTHVVLSPVSVLHLDLGLDLK